MRTLTEHAVNEANSKLILQVLDEPGEGGACHRYKVSGFETTLTDPDNKKIKIKDFVEIRFQKGPTGVEGVNGITQEVLLSIVADRLRGFQSDKYACAENQVALGLVEAALQVLKTAL